MHLTNKVIYELKSNDTDLKKKSNISSYQLITESQFYYVESWSKLWNTR